MEGEEEVGEAHGASARVPSGPLWDFKCHSVTGSSQRILAEDLISCDRNDSTDFVENGLSGCNRGSRRPEGRLQ